MSGDTDETLFLTTQPGWAFASLGEARALGERAYAAFHHRDSSIVVPARQRLLRERLITPAEVLGLVLRAERTRWRDATECFQRRLDPALFADAALRWLPAARASRATWRSSARSARPPSRRYSVVAEVWGDTALHRHALADLVRETVRRSMPGWTEAPAGGVRLLCKADPEMALLGVQLYRNLGDAEDGTGASYGRGAGNGRAGALREHLACALLTLAHVQPDDVVLDPFMGTGTILRAAGRWFGVTTCVGAEIDADAFGQAERHVGAPGAWLANRSFERLDVRRLPRAVKLVSNLPFGVQFAQVDMGRLLAFLARLRPHLAGVSLLLARDQAGPVADALGLRVKHVLVLGQPAAVVYEPY